MTRFIAFASLLASLLLFSCSQTVTGSGGSITISVYTHGETIVENHTADVEAGTTAFDLFSDYMRENNIPYTVSGGGATVYIKSVNGIKEFDNGPESGWIYTVNGERISQSCGAYQLNDKDIIVFKYITEYEDNI